MQSAMVLRLQRAVVSACYRISQGGWSFAISMLIMLTTWQTVVSLAFVRLSYSQPTEYVQPVNDQDTFLGIEPMDISLVVGEIKTATFIVKGPLPGDLELTLNEDLAINVTPHKFTMSPGHQSVDVKVQGVHITSFTVLEVQHCAFVDNSTTECPLRNLNRTFAEVRVVHSKALSVTVIIVGWIYFLAWSISFYPQIYLNFKRRSVVGLNFDFLLLNIIGFTCYTFYNVLMYFDANVQEIYERTHPHSHIPVLLNDVVFALHALFACFITALQCFFYTRGGQRVSYTCSVFSVVLIAFSIISFLLSVFNVVDTLQFIMMLSYVKMAVTLSKYFPQAFYNYRRKSTTGWSIGNVLLDFMGGSMDILQMVLQAANSDDWTAFYGNPVKFGLGFVSMIFDTVFIVQHYILYRNPPEVLPMSASTEDIKTEDNTDNASIDTTPSDDGSSVPIIVDARDNPVV